MDKDFWERYNMGGVQAAQDDLERDLLIKNLREVVTKQGETLRQYARKFSRIEEILESQTQRIMELEKGVKNA